MRNFEKPAALVSRRQTGHKRFNSAQSPSLREARRELGGHELTARINVLPLSSPASSIESRIESIERKRSRDEGNIFKQAVSEMNALTQIVQNVSRDAGKWETQLRHARLILSEPDVPSKLRHEVLEYLKAWHIRARSRAEIPADMLPPRLERQVFCALHQDLCKAFPLIQTLQRGHETGVTFFSEVSQKFSESMYVPMEQLVAQDASCERVHFIVQGEVHVYSSKYNPTSGFLL